jgi:hypothetical protein
MADMTVEMMAALPAAWMVAQKVALLADLSVASKAAPMVGPTVGAMAD